MFTVAFPVPRIPQLLLNNLCSCNTCIVFLTELQNYNSKYIGLEEVWEHTRLSLGKQRSQLVGMRSALGHYRTAYKPPAATAPEGARAWNQGQQGHLLSAN